MRARLKICSLVLAGMLLMTAAAAAPAHAQNKRDALVYEIFADYSKDGQIDPCKHTADELKLALGSITPDIRQYASDFPDAIKAAIAARARGVCDGSAGAAAPGAATPPAAPPASAASTPAPAPTGGATQTVVPEPPSPANAAPPVGSDDDLERAAATGAGNETPIPLIGLGVLAALMVLTALLLLAMKRLGLDEGRLAPVYHSWREASWRAGGVWEDFRDWLRIGR